MADNKQMFALVGIVAIVAIVGIVSLLLPGRNVVPANAYETQPFEVDDSNYAGEAIRDIDVDCYNRCEKFVYMVYDDGHSTEQQMALRWCAKECDKGVK